MNKTQDLECIRQNYLVEILLNHALESRRDVDLHRYFSFPLCQLQRHIRVVKLYFALKTKSQLITCDCRIGLYLPCSLPCLLT